MQSIVKLHLTCAFIKLIIHTCAEACACDPQVLYLRGCNDRGSSFGGESLAPHVMLPSIRDLSPAALAAFRLQARPGCEGVENTLRNLISTLKE